jgi:hypothetical protein
MLARRFLYAIAGLVLLVLAGAIAWNLFQDSILRAVFVPNVAFSAPAAGAGPDYARPESWLARPDLARDPSRWTPPGLPKSSGANDVAVFYVPPTTYLGRDRWNTPLDDTESRDRLRLFASSQASAFNGAAAIWAPRYRSASMGAFLTGEADATRALDFAYRDVLAAWDAFIAAQPADRPIILAGHSQGSLHLLRLLRERIAGTPVARRIVAAYLVGWPISTTADIPALGLPGCVRADQANCIVSWQSFAEPADPHQIVEIYERTKGFNGADRRGTPMLCVNPLTGTAGGAAPASANLGAIVPADGLKGGALVPAKVGARCDPSGFLLIGAAPEGYSAYVMPGQNFHVFDYALFWANVRRDAARRVAAFEHAR